MGTFLNFRQKAMNFFARNEAFFMPVLKFITMMAVLLLMNWHLGYRYVQMLWLLVILVSLISALLPWKGITALAALYLIGHVSALTLEGTAVLVLLMLGIALLHYLFLPGGSVLVMLIPLAFYLKVPYLIPLLAGVFGTALSIIPVAGGVTVYYLMLCLEKNAAVFTDPGTSIVTNFMTVMNGMNNAELYLTLAAFCLTVIVVYGISHLSADYAPAIAAVVGGILLLLTCLLGGFFLSVGTSFFSMLISCIICTVLAAAVSGWVLILDYSCTEYLQYEDDDYVYYVKAVPKIRIAKAERRVHDIEADDDEPYDADYDEDYDADRGSDYEEEPEKE